MKFKKSEYLALLASMIKDQELSARDRVSLAKLYAKVGGLRKNPRKRTLVPRKNKPEPVEPTMDEIIVQLEKDFKNGQQHTER